MILSHRAQRRSQPCNGHKTIMMNCSSWTKFWCSVPLSWTIEEEGLVLCHLRLWGFSVVVWFMSCSDDHNPHYGEVLLTGPDYIALLSQCWPGCSAVLIGRLLHGFCEYRTFGAKTGTSQGKWEPPHLAQPVMWVGMLLFLTMQNCADSLWLVRWWI